MLRDFFKIAFRNISRSKGFCAINIIGLAIGMASAVIISKYKTSKPAKPCRLPSV